ncbi:MAG: hypothetical protein ACM3S5_03730, partial [Rhodospirillales bacterium]
GSHVYNVWLADQIRAGGLEGLVFVRVWTNFLFDELLSAIIHSSGYAAGQRMAVALVALIFFWGAFRFAAALSRAPVWPAAPLLAILTYGWAFHMGFFNYLLGTGLSLWAATLLLQPTATRIFGGLALMSLGVAAHALPVACVAAILAYVHISRRVTRRAGICLFAAAFACIVLARLLLPSHFVTVWTPLQVFTAAGMDQAWVFDQRYAVFALVLTIVMLHMLLRSGGIGDAAVQLWLLACAGVVLIPRRISLPGFNHDLGYISDRSSLIAAVLLVAVAAGVKLSRSESVALGAVSIVFFGMLYFDTRDFNRVEDGIEAVLSGAPRGSRVVLGIHSEGLRIDPITHMIDRACIGRCYSYGNYEPSTKHFRVRAIAPNPFVVDNYRDSWEIQFGEYRVRAREEPIFAVCEGENGMFVRELRAGETIPRTPLRRD